MSWQSRNHQLQNCVIGSIRALVADPFGRVACSTNEESLTRCAETRRAAVALVTLDLTGLEVEPVSVRNPTAACTTRSALNAC
jgi:hypothetical protein